MQKMTKFEKSTMQIKTKKIDYNHISGNNVVLPQHYNNVQKIKE